MDLLEEIRLLANIETSETKLLSVVLAGSARARGAVERQSAAPAQAADRAALRAAPLTMTETLGYVAGRIGGGRGNRRADCSRARRS